MGLDLDNHFDASRNSNAIFDKFKVLNEPPGKKRNIPGQRPIPTLRYKRYKIVSILNRVYPSHSGVRLIEISHQMNAFFMPKATGCLATQFLILISVLMTPFFLQFTLG